VLTEQALEFLKLGKGADKLNSIVNFLVKSWPIFIS